jgi:hypothetical protein
MQIKSSFLSAVLPSESKENLFLQALLGISWATIIKV